MKIIKRSILVAFIGIGFIANLAALPKDNIEPKVELRQEVKELLGSPELDNQRPVSASINFMLNSANEIVVLNVSSESSYISNLVKSRLNYKKVSADALKNSQYTIRVTFKQESAY